MTDDLGSPVFPTAKDDDDDDVAWALSTAQVQWKRGAAADAVVWLRRAIDSAVSVGATWRAAELTRQTDELEAHLMSPPIAPPPLSVPGEVAIDDFDGTDIIDEEAVSLPPDASMSEPPAAHIEPLSADSTDEHTDVTPEEDAPDEGAAIDEMLEEDEVLEIDEDDISEDELGEEPERELPRFQSEAPTANVPHPGLAALEAAAAEAAAAEAAAAEAAAAEAAAEAAAAEAAAAEAEAELRGEGDTEPESEIPDTVSERQPETLSEPAGDYDAADEDPAPTPVRLSVADPIQASEPEQEPEREPEPEPAAPALTEPYVAGISLAEISGFEDFPPETQLELAQKARVERLATDEEISGFGLALVLRGAVNVMPAIADVSCGAAQERELVYGKGTLQEGVALRLVATAPDTQIAIWDFQTIQPPLSECPWVLAELQNVADRFQALAGVAMGPMGDRLDDSLRGMVLSRCKLVKLLPGEMLVEKGKPVGGLFIVGAGRIELGAVAGAEGELQPGDFVFPTTILMAGSAPTAARAGSAGALIMAADRHDAHELMVSVPPLLELLAG